MPRLPHTPLVQTLFELSGSWRNDVWICLLLTVPAGSNSKSQNISCHLPRGGVESYSPQTLVENHFAVLFVSVFHQAWRRCQRWLRSGSRSWPTKSTDRCSSAPWTPSRSCCPFSSQVHTGELVWANDSAGCRASSRCYSNTGNYSH